MAIIQCPKCGNKVSTFSEVCPFCRHPIEKNNPIDSVNNNKSIDQVNNNQTIVIPKPKNTFWIYNWTAKTKKTKIILTICLIVSIIGLIISACLLSFDIDLRYDGPKIIHLIFTLIFSCLVIVLFSLWLAALICCKVKAMRFDGYVVLGYIGFFKNYLVIEDVIKDSGLIKSYLYGSLPNKKQVIMTISYAGSIKLEISNYAGDIII